MILKKSDYMKILQENIATVICNNSIAEEIFQLWELKAKSETDSIIRDEKLTRITELFDYLKTHPSKITVFDESFFRRLLQKITVFGDHFMVEFKSDVNVINKLNEQCCYKYNNSASHYLSCYLAENAPRQ